MIHGSTLVTQDLDICAAITDAQVAKLREALKDLHPWHRMNPAVHLSFLDHPRSIAGINNIYLQTDLGVLDVLSETQPAGNFQQLKSRAVELAIYGHKCKIIAIEDLIKIKEAMKRPKDLQAAEELRVIAKLVRSL